MPDPTTEPAVQVRPVVDDVHLVDAQALEAVGVGLDGIEQRHRFAVGQRHDDVAVGRQVIEHPDRGPGATPTSSPRSRRHRLTNARGRRS